MSDTLKVRPKAGVQVRKEDGTPLPKGKSTEVPNNSYYRRRLRDGDLIDHTPKQKKGAEQ